MLYIVLLNSKDFWSVIRAIVKEEYLVIIVKKYLP